MTGGVAARRPPCLCAARSYKGQKNVEIAWVIDVARRSVVDALEDEDTPNLRQQRSDLCGGCPSVPACVGDCEGGSTLSGK